MKRRLEKLKKARRLLRFAMKVCAHCQPLGLIYLFEHPWGAESWEEPAVTNVMKFPDTRLAKGDQCMMGLRSNRGTPRRKRLGFMTNNEEIAKAMKVQCSQDHEHSHIIGSDATGKLSAQCQKYPQGLMTKVLQAYRKGIDETLEITQATEKIKEDAEFDINYAEKLGTAAWNPRGANIKDWETDLPDENDEIEIFDLDNEDEEEAKEDDGTEGSQAFPWSHPTSLERLLKRAHEGLGHLSRDRFIRILKNAKAEKKIIDMARNFSCSVCEQHKLTASSTS